MSVAVVMPAYNASDLLHRSLSSWLERAPEVVVVDAGSTDDTALVAKELGARVLRLPERAGPAEARNAGARAVDTEVVLFADADCVPIGDVVQRVAAAFRTDPYLVSLTGSYDDAPPARNFASLYMNLRHHAVHQRASRENASFWAGCGAVRRAAFEAVGGFDAARYPRPMIEDIELGMRMRHQGATRLDPDMQVKHLKRWTLASVVWTDVFCRALPWSELIVQSGDLPDDLNLERSQRVAAALAPLALAAVVLLPLGLAMGHWWLAALAAVVIAVSVRLQAPLLRVFARSGGFVFAVAGWAFHQLHLIYSAASFVWCLVFRRRRAA